MNYTQTMAVGRRCRPSFLLLLALSCVFPYASQVAPFYVNSRHNSGEAVS